MKNLFLLTCLCSSFTLWCQNLTEKVGVIEVQFVNHYYLLDEFDQVTKKKNNRKNRPFERVFLDANGKTLKKITYGKQHNTDLRLVNDISVYQYQNDKLQHITQYESSYEKYVYPFSKKVFVYENDTLIKHKNIQLRSEKITSEVQYEYDKQLNETKKIIDTGYYYQSEYDANNRLTTYSQIYGNKLRWKWTYTYTESQRFGFFETFYEKDNYSKKEIQTFNAQKQLIEIESLYLSKLEIREKVRLYYRRNGLLKRIENYKSYSKDEAYDLTSYIDVKVKSKVRIDKKLVKKINNLY